MVNHVEGAPPLPPQGGYRGASRAAQVASHHASHVAERIDTVTLERPRRRHHWAGWVALGATVLFAFTLLIMAFAGTSSALFSTTLVVVQLLVLATVVAALAIRNARTLGIAALTIALVANVATVGSFSALQAAKSGSYAVEKSPAQQHNQGFPGVDGFSENDILAMRTLEEERAVIAEVFAEVRDELSREFGVTWTQTSSETTRLMRNGRGGESMLYTAYFDGWTTNEPVTSVERKYAMLDTAGLVFLDHGFSYPYPFNVDDGSLPPTQLQNLYGGLVPEEQPLWSSVTWEGWSSQTSVYLEILDLSLDSTGDFGRGAEARRARPSDPIEGFMLSAVSEPLLAEADRDEFTERMRSY